MSREEFMRQLEYLLQDIEDEDKADALQYYKDYFEEAGEGHEEQVIKEFGSPERIAAMIRSDISGHLEEGGEFTESGYQDIRFKDPNYQVTKRYDLPEERIPDQKPEEQSRPQPRTSRILKTILWCILIIVAIPAILGIGGGILGILGGVGGVLIAVFVVVAALTIAFLLASAGLFIGGILCLLIEPLKGMLLLGLSIAFLGIGLLFLALSVVFYGRFLPFLFRSILDIFNRLFHGGRRNVG